MPSTALSKYHSLSLSNLGLVSHVDDGTTSLSEGQIPKSQTYRLYKRRFAGLFGLFVLNVVAAMGWPWFGPIASSTAYTFSISLNQVNWLANIVSCVYLPSTIVIPWVVSRYGLRRCCDIGVMCLIISGWIRYAGTAPGLSGTGSFLFLITGQFISAIAQSIFQVLAPKYSESWFDLGGRTTATMVISIANPIGSAAGQILSPAVDDVKKSIFVLAIISSGVLPFIFLISDKPPTPPTASAEQKARSLQSLVLDTIGKPKHDQKFTPMTHRERFDFIVVTILFGINVSVINTFSILSSQDLSPYGYSSDISGLMGASLLLSGILAAVITAPLFDRVFTTRMGLTVKILIPILAAAWMSLVWTVRPNNAGALFATFSIIGACGVTLLPVALELAVEFTGAADASSAMLWFSGNAFTIMLTLVEPALKAGPEASPPFHMRNGLILQGALLIGLALLVIPFQGKQKRRMKDEAIMEAVNAGVHDGHTLPVPEHGEVQGFSSSNEVFEREPLIAE